MVVDGGNYGAYDQSQEWSSGGDGNAKPGEPWSNTFNGAVSPNYAGHTVANDGATATLTFSPPVSFNKLEIFGNNNDEAGAIILNGSTSTWGVVPTGGGDTVAFADCTSLLPGGSLSSISLENTSNSDPSRIGGVRINGKLLTDTSATPTGKTEATGPKKSGVATFVSTNGTDTMSVDNSNNEWISNDNRLGEEFFIKKIFTALNANDPAHVAMSEAVTAAFAAFPVNVSSRRAAITSSLSRLIAGETLTAEEATTLTTIVNEALD